MVKFILFYLFIYSILFLGEGLRKNEYFGGMKIFKIFVGVTTKFD